MSALARWLLLVPLCLAVACSFSHSSKSSSNSSRSSSGSSSPSGSAFERDVRDYTAKYAKTKGDVTTFRRDLGGIAQDHGVSDWERDQETYVGIGRGLGQAKVKGAELEQFKLDLAGANAQYMAWIKTGYDQENQK